MNERDYLRLKRRFEKEYKEKLRALELIWQEASGGKKAPREHRDSGESNGTAPRGNAAAAVAEFVQQSGGIEFTAKQIDAWIVENKGARANRTTIIHKLRRMVNDGELVVASHGSGKRSSVYRLPEKTPASQGTPQPTQAAPPAMATEEDIDQMRQLLESQNVVPGEFVRDVMRPEFGVVKLRELTRDQIQELILRYTPIDPPPNESIPF